MAITFSRRGLLRASGAGLTLALLPGGALAVAASAGAPAGGTTVNDWLHVAGDGTITIFSNAQEMGQGGFSGVAQMLAEELCVPWDRVTVKTAPLKVGMGMGSGRAHWTGGSSSIRTQWERLRRAGAAARQMLVAAGAAHLEVPAAECRAMEGGVHHMPSGRHVDYAVIADAAARQPVPDAPAMLPRSQWRLIGRPLLRKDIPAKVDGSAVFATDVQVPGLLSATLMQSPVFGGRLVSVDPAPALRVPGVRHVVPVMGVTIAIPGLEQPMVMADAVAVVASHWWAARQGLLALAPVWDNQGKDDLDTDGMHAAIMARLDGAGTVRVTDGQDEAAQRARHDAGMARATTRFSRDYRVPALAHAQMEPLSAVVHIRSGTAEAWTGSQAPSSVRRIVAGAAGLTPDQVTTHTLMSGGGFGRRFIDDYVAYAAILSRSVSAPVKLVYTREEDMAQGRYRTATACRITAGLGPDGLPIAVHTHCVPAGGDVLLSMVGPGHAAQPDHQPSYYLPAPLAAVTQAGLPVPFGPWRAPGSTQCAFFFETFVDELAEQAGQDPLAYRRRLLADNPRALRVLDAAATAAGWGRPLPAGRGLGLAIWNSFEAIAAQVVEVEVSDRRLRVTRVWCAFDCGTAVNPDSVRAQGEGSILMALSATLAEKVELAKGAVTSLNYDRYPLLRLNQMPAIEIILLESPDAPVGGAGEPMTPPLPPALANALFAATGQRIRSLPLTDHGFTTNL